MVHFKYGKEEKKGSVSGVWSMATWSSPSRPVFIILLQISESCAAQG